MNWPALGRDPAPGDPAEVRSAADRVRAVAERCEPVRFRLVPLTVGSLGQVWTGPAANLFVEGIRELDTRFGEMADAHRAAESALRVYADALERAQQTARRAEDDAAHAIEDKRTAVRARNDAEHDKARARVGFAAAEIDRQTALVTQLGTTVLAPGLAPFTVGTTEEATARRDRWEELESAARGREKAAEQAIDSAEQRLDAARNLAEQARQERLHAAKDLVKVLQDNAPKPYRPSLLGAAQTSATASGATNGAATRLRDNYTDTSDKDGDEGRRWKDKYRGAEKNPGLSAESLDWKGLGVLNKLGTIGDVFGAGQAGYKRYQEDGERFDLSEGERNWRAVGAGTTNFAYNAGGSWGIVWLTTAAGTAIAPGPGTVIGAGVGVVAVTVGSVVDDKMENWINDRGADAAGAIYNAVDGVADRVDDAASNFGREAADTTGAVFKEIGRRWPWK